MGPRAGASAPVEGKSRRASTLGQTVGADTATCGPGVAALRWRQGSAERAACADELTSARTTTRRPFFVGPEGCLRQPRMTVSSGMSPEPVTAANPKRHQHQAGQDDREKPHQGAP